MTDFLGDELTRLLSITAGCRDDMHEPDEQGLRARVFGDHLDNAFGDRLDVKFLIGGHQELVVILDRVHPPTGMLPNGIRLHDSFNLATLIALARKAKL